MKLQRLYVNITGVVFDSKSFIEEHVLHVSKKDLENVASSPAFAKVDFEIAAPGERCRITNMGDIVQPMIKLGEKGTTFPGVADDICTVGSGTSLLLCGVVVSETVEVPLQIPCLMETTPEAAEMTDFANMIHLVMDAFPAETASRSDYLDAVCAASKRVAKYLASLAADLTPDDEETFQLEKDGLEGLPKVAYLADVFCHAPYEETMVYGASMIESLPTILHPNEILDGAVTNKDYDNAINADPTYVWQNHPIIQDLYRRHGKELNFVGVVLNNVHHIVTVKHRNAAMASSLLANQLKAEGVIITKEGGGHPQVDVGFAADILEQEYGVKAVMLFAEFLSPNHDANGQLLIKSEHADAIVSTGCFEIVEMPPVDRLIGHVPVLGADNKPIQDSVGTIRIKNRSLQGCESQMGWTKFGSQKF